MRALETGPTGLSLAAQVRLDELAARVSCTPDEVLNALLRGWPVEEQEKIIQEAVARDRRAQAAWSRWAE